MTTKESNKQFDDVKASLHTEALKLADELDKLHQYVPSEAPAMIRRLVEELDKKTKPLSDEEIEKLREYHGINDWLYETSIIDFARAIEERHGIK